MGDPEAASIAGLSRVMLTAAEGDKVVNIDDNLVYEFVWAWEYTHGARSMEAIIRMSALEDGTQFRGACLLPKAQLSMQAGSTVFTRHG